MGHCTEVSHSKEEVRNIIENHAFLFDLQGTQDREQTLKYLDWCNANLHLKPVLNNKDYEELYEAMGSVIVPERVSKIGQRAYQRNNPNWVAHESIDNDKKRDTGIFIHKTLENIFNALINDGSIEDAKKSAMNGEFPMSDAGFNNLVKGAKTIIKQMEDVQEKINAINGTKEKVIFRVEQKVIDSVKGIAGAMDLVAIFSDNTAAIIDYKTKLSYKDKVDGELVSESAIDTYNLTVGEYKRILKDRLGIKEVRLSRVIPIQINLEKKSKVAKRPGDSFNNKLTTVKMLDEEYLSQIPVAGEASEYRGLNKLLNEQLALAKKLEDQLKDKALSYDDKQLIKLRILNIKKGVRKTLVKGELKGIIIDAHEILGAFRNKLKEDEFLPSMEKNPNYITQSELRDFINELSVYNDLISNTNEYLNDFKKLDPTTYKDNIDKIFRLVPAIQSALEHAKTLDQQMASDIILDEFKDKSGNLLPQMGLNWGEATFLNLSEINHPLFIALNTLKDEATYEIRDHLKKFYTELETVQTALFKWGKDHGYNTQQVYDLMINKETGNMVAKLKSELWDIKNKAILDKDLKTLKSLFKHRFETDELYLEDLKKRKEFYAKRLLGKFNNLEDTLDTDGATVITSKAQHTKEYKRLLNKWDEQNNLLKSEDAWYNPYLYDSKALVVKKEVKEKYATSEYDYIRNNKELNDFYNFFESKIDMFRKTLGLSDKDGVPYNFIPNIRKTIVEQLIDNQSLLKPLKEIWESLSVREEDVHIKSQNSSTGELVRKIPKLFINKFENKSDKSFNLGRVLTLFANMTYEYEYLSQIEVQALALKDMLGSPAASQGGELAVDKFNNPIKGFLDKFAITKDSNTRTYKLLEDFIDYYIYGIKFKESSLLKKYDTTNMGLAAKNYLSLKQLAFAVIPSSGALVAGQTGVYLEGKKGVSYTSAQWKQSLKLLATDRKKMLGIAGFFDVYSEDPIERMMSEQSTRKVDEYINNRFAFSPLRRVDENITDTVLTSMIQNWGIDANGNLVRLNKPVVDKSIKSLLETATYDEKTGQLKITGINKTNYIAFRTAVKATMQNIIGNMSSEDVARTDLSLGLSLAMQFKTWMPALIQDRVGKIRYDQRLQSLKQGRYGAYASIYKRTEEELRNGMTIAGWFTHIVVPNLGKLSLDIATFGLSGKLGIKRINEDRARRHYIMWKLSIEKTNPGLANKVTFEEFLDMKQRQINAFINELRMVIIFASILMYLGGDDPETGKPRYMENRASRLFMKTLGKANSELSLGANPGQFLDLLTKNPVPLTKLITDLRYTFKNTFDETRDDLFGENASNDPTPRMYYTSQWMIGGSQMARLFELFDAYKASPYEK